eukprot:NODE_3660_length_2003_cov_2.729744.p1 GENE.NODE_3660_length_2003_cov_2.729744~~NODE_3660_length_2003_cov_2.729744.p1  ORF type:complete len:613 (-),score=135.36 NODE_3660_length_2003_cov_2.729744:164-1876(-)
MAFIILLALMTSTARGHGYVRSSEHAFLDVAAFQAHVEDAVGASLGCGKPVSEQRLATIRAVLLPMWHTLPKTNSDRIEQRSLRFLAYRYFMQVSSLSIRGFEPSRPSDKSNFGAADLLSERVPAYVESALESQRAVEQGFTLEDAVSVAAMLEQLIAESDGALMEKAYVVEHFALDSSLGRKDLIDAISTYAIEWILGEDTVSDVSTLPQGSADIPLRQSPSWQRLQSIVPDWPAVHDFIAGRIRALEFLRWRTPHQVRSGFNILSSRFTLDDAKAVAAGVTASFHAYWQPVCNSMKQSLVQWDTQRIGRVPLAKFYHMGEMRFAESEAYLRELGALDESSRWRGKQVIISNYLQAASNCLIWTPHYNICCMSECEMILGEVERGVGSPVATPAQLLSIVGNMTTYDSRDEPLRLDGALTQGLMQIATGRDDGLIPVDGRLFAQWLHYIFPQECPFPHKAGESKRTRPTEFTAGEFSVSKEDRQRHAETAETLDPATTDDVDWMSQWSDEEELFAEHMRAVQAPWDGNTTSAVLHTLATLMFVAVVFASIWAATRSEMHGQRHVSGRPI